MNSTVEDVSLKESLSYASVEGVLERRIDRWVDCNQIASLEILGLDEIALKKRAKEERKTLNLFFAHSDLAQQAYAFREQLTAIFDMKLSKKQAMSRIRRWIKQVQQCGLHCFDKLLNLLETWWEDLFLGCGAALRLPCIHILNHVFTSDGTITTLLTYYPVSVIPPIMRAQRFLETDTIILGILVIGVLGLVTDYAFKISYNLLFPWMRRTR